MGAIITSRHQATDHLSANARRIVRLEAALEETRLALFTLVAQSGGSVAMARAQMLEMDGVPVKCGSNQQGDLVFIVDWSERERPAWVPVRKPAGKATEAAAPDVEADVERHVMDEAPNLAAGVNGIVEKLRKLGSIVDRSEELTFDDEERPS